MALSRSGWESMASTMGESRDGGGGADDGKENGGVEVNGEEVEARGEGAVAFEECGVV